MSGETVLYSGRDDGQHRGLAIILKKGADRSHLEWKPINIRDVSSPLKIRLRGKDNSYTDKFTYIGSILYQDGDTGVDIQKRLNKATKYLYEIKTIVEISKLQYKDKALGLPELRVVNPSLRL